MLWFIILLVFAAVTVALPFIPIGYDAHGDTRRIPAGFVLIPIALFAVITLAMSSTMVDSGNVGVVYQFGSIVGTKGEGFALTAPWQSVHEENVKAQSHTFEGLNAFSVETQDVFMDVSLNYSVDPERVATLLRTVGQEWFDVLVPSRVNNFVKNETVKYAAIEIAPNRETIRKNVQAVLAADLADDGVIVLDLLINNISFNDAFEDAVEQKQVATEEAKKALEQVKLREYEARQQVATAEGQAEIVRLNAEADAAAILIRAQANADANKLLASALTPALIQYQYVTKLSPNVKVLLLPSGAPFILPGDVLSGE